jgi:glycosyltransferase involved in cell wall biosynthesis
MRPLHVAFISEDDSSKPSSWSGIPYSIYQALVANGASVTRHTPARAKSLRFVEILQRFTANRLPAWNHRYSSVSLRSLARSLRRSLNKCSHADFLLSVHPDPIAYAALTQPCGFIGDCNIELLAQSYPGFACLNKGMLPSAAHMWEAGLKRAEFCALASDWAAADTCSRYPELAHKVKVLPFGSNLTTNWTEPLVEQHIAARSFHPLRLLSVGVDWNRKGMADAIGAFEKLRQMGICAVLDIVGCCPPSGVQLPKGVTTHGRLDLSVPKTKAQLKLLFEEAHIFIMASRADCFGIVFAEASSHAVPSLGVAACGVPTAVRDGVTGRLFPVEGWQEAAAQEIRLWLDRPPVYRNLAMNAWSDSVKRLNWEVVGAQLLQWIRENAGKSE